MQVARGTTLAVAGLLTAAAVTAAVVARRRDVDGGEPPATTTAPSTAPRAARTEEPAQPAAVEPRPAEKPASPEAPSANPASDPWSEYTVRPGDTLSAIAHRFDTSVDALVELNSLAAADRLDVGQRLRVPRAADAVPVTATDEQPPAPTRPLEPLVSGSPPEVPAGPVINRVAGAGGRVALTFDDGPAAATDAILGALTQHDVRATFFVVGRQAARDGARLARMHDAGHVIANHSWDHSDLTGLDTEQVRRQLADTSLVIQQATGRAPDIFRPPYGARNERIDDVARQLGMRDITWDVDTRDWTRPGTEAVVRAAVDGARDGSIILLHDGGGDRNQTAAAIGPIVAGLRERGFQIVTVPELVAAGR